LGGVIGHNQNANWDKELTLIGATMSEEEREDIQQDLQENDWAGNRKGNCQIFHLDLKKEELDVMEVSAPSEMKEEPIQVFSIRTRNVGALATPGVMGKRRTKKTFR
jgi:hypothetical protein